ncbi:MAG: hypothetical protein M0R46_13125 [Candidatus Muirbacterium halophilum]|nr:hypothetical protein [Candidatus Muirbacterium halophilum]MCK9476862.1 hypothetical protein [Candidatus Muirbacterium halophilum]
MRKTMKLILILIMSLFIFLLTGCGGTTEKSGTISNVTKSNVLNSAWEAYYANGFDAARVTFANALEDEESYDSITLAQINNGMGWAMAKTDGFKYAKPYFEKAQKLVPDSKVGLAAAHLSSMDIENIKAGITLLESLNINNAHYEYMFKYNTGMTNAQVHSLMGCLYWCNGDVGKAASQFNVVGDIINKPGQEMSYQTVNAILSSFSSNY